MNQKINSSNILRTFVFVFLIMMPSMLFWRLTFLFSADSIGGIVVRFANIMAVPIEIFVILFCNTIGVIILHKERFWKIISMLYLFIQTIVSIVIAIRIKINLEKVIGNVIIFDIFNNDSYYLHSMLLLCLANILFFCITIIILFYKKTKSKKKDS